MKGIIAVIVLLFSFLAGCATPKLEPQKFEKPFEYVFVSGQAAWDLHKACVRRRDGPFLDKDWVGPWIIENESCRVIADLSERIILILDLEI